MPQVTSRLTHYYAATTYDHLTGDKKRCGHKHRKHEKAIECRDKLKCQHVNVGLRIYLEAVDKE